MAIDASIAAGQAAPNVLQSLMGVTQLKGAMLQQQQLNQQMGANRATSAAMQQAYDPATGRIDTNKLTAILSQDPDAAYNLPTVQGQILEQQNKQLEFDKNKFDLGVKQNNYFKNQFAPLAARGNVTPQELSRIGAGMVKDGLLSVEDVVRGMQDIPQDQAGRDAWVKQRYIQSLDNASQLEAMMPKTQVLNNGPTQQIVAIDPMTGRPTVTGTIQNGMDPNTASSPVPAYDRTTGAPVNLTREQFQQQANGGMQPGSTIGLPGTGTNGRYPGQQPQGQAPGGPAMGVQTGPSLGQTAAAETLGKGNAENILSLQDRASGAPDRIRFLQDMTSNLDHFNSGPTSGWTAQAKALFLQLAPDTAKKLGVDPQSVASKEEFTKYAAQIAMSAMKGMGSGTDSQLATAVSGNPHAELSKLGLQEMMKVITGTERATMAKNLAWQNSGISPDKYGKWEAQWNNDIDPRVFVTPEMTQEDRAKMYNGLKPADQKRFASSYKTAVDAGIIQRPAQ